MTNNANNQNYRAFGPKKVLWRQTRGLIAQHSEVLLPHDFMRVTSLPEPPALPVPLRAHVELFHLFNARDAVKRRIHFQGGKLGIAGFAAAEF